MRPYDYYIVMQGMLSEKYDDILAAINRAEDLSSNTPTVTAYVLGCYHPWTVWDSVRKDK